ncbi:unnamed protein product, partial [Prorocentrum cordatum]
EPEPAQGLEEALPEPPPEPEPQDSVGHGWHSFTIYGSLAEGNPDGLPEFCIVIAVILEIVVSDPRLAAHRRSILHWLYMDDWIVQVPLPVACTLLEVIVGAAAARNLPLQLAKCAFHIPVLAGTRPENLPDAARALADRIQYSPDGPVLLGTEARGDLEVPLYAGAGGAIPQPTARRLDRARRLAEAVLEMVQLAPLASAKQAGLAPCGGVVAYALDCGAGVLPCSVLLPHVRVLDQHVLRAVAAAIDESVEALTEEEVEQTGLPDGVDAAVAEGVHDLLQERGISSLSGRGRPCALAGAAVADSLRPAAPERHLLSAYLHLCTHPVSRQAGSCWPKGPDTSPDAPGTICLNVKASTSEACGNLLDQDDDHAAPCECGPFRNLRHEGIADAYADIMAEIGGPVRRDVFARSSPSRPPRHGWTCGEFLSSQTVWWTSPFAAPCWTSTSGQLLGQPAAPRGPLRWRRPTGTHLLAAAARGRGRTRPSGGSASGRRDRLLGNSLRWWRAQLDAALMRGLAAQLISAWCGSP